MTCGQFVSRIPSTQPITNGKEWERMSNLKIPWWLQLSKRQILTFLPRLSFGTVRSVVRIHSPRPVNLHLIKNLRSSASDDRFSRVANLWTKFFGHTAINRLRTRQTCKKPAKNVQLRAFVPRMVQFFTARNRALCPDLNHAFIDRSARVRRST